MASLAPLTIASIVFLALYFILFIILTAGLVSKRISLKSRWLPVFFHVTIRVAAQAVGIAFGVLSFSARDLLIAYLVLATEGYFSLVLSLTLFIVKWQRDVQGESWLARDDLGKDHGWVKAVLWHLVPRLTRPIETGKWCLLVSNILIITGASLLASSTETGPDFTPIVSPGAFLSTQAMRGIGQGLFLLCNLALCACLIFHLIYDDKRPSFLSSPEKAAKEMDTPPEGSDEPSSMFVGQSGTQRPHLTLIILTIVSLLLTIRGAFGIAQGVSWKLCYYNVDIYDQNGFVSSFVVEETLLATLPEWLSCAGLILSGMIGKRLRSNALKESKAEG